MNSLSSVVSEWVSSRTNLIWFFGLVDWLHMHPRNFCTRKASYKKKRPFRFLQTVFGEQKTFLGCQRSCYTPFPLSETFVYKLRTNMTKSTKNRMNKKQDEMTSPSKKKSSGCLSKRCADCCLDWVVFPAWISTQDRTHPGFCFCS